MYKLIDEYRTEIAILAPSQAADLAGTTESNLHSIINLGYGCKQVGRLFLIEDMVAGFCGELR